MLNKLIAETFGTFALALAILTSLHGDSLIPTPVIAALTVVLFVFTIGERSGAHLNPAVTLGLWSINKIGQREAGFYIIAQVIGAALAAGLLAVIFGDALNIELAPESLNVFLAEAVGSILFGFGIAAVVYNKVPKPVSGPVIGGSLLLGIILAFGLGSAGILNPAIAMALGTLNLSYIFGSIIGIMLGMNLYRGFIA